MKKKYLILMLLALIAATLPFVASAATESGELGFNRSWTLDDSGVLTILGKGAITSHPWDNSKVKKLVISNGITKIGDSVFKGCTKITSVTIPNSVKSIGEYAFQSCTRLAGVTIPGSVTSIGKHAFSDCSSDLVFQCSSGSAAEEYAKANSIKVAKLENDVKPIKEIKSGKCGANLTWTLDEEGVLTISGTGNMYNYTYRKSAPWKKSIKRVIIQNGVTGIGNYAFYKSWNLTSVTIPNSVTSISNPYIFQGCSSKLEIECSAGSAAEEYAKANGIKVKLMDVHITYHWGIDCPVDQTLPDPSTVNPGGSYTVDSTFVQGTTVTGTKDRKKGIWTFSGWDKSGTITVHEDMTITGAWTFSVANYTVTWMNDDGTTILGTATLPYGTSADEVKAKAPAAIPTKDATAQYTYTFAGYTPAYEEVTGDRVYQAQYISTIKRFTVAYDWGIDSPSDQALPGPATVNAGGSYAVDSTFVQGTAVTGTKDGKNGAWTFSGWDKSGTITVHGDMTITGAWTFKETSYTMTAQDDGNGTAAASLPEAVAGTEITLTAAAKDGYHFKEWQAVAGSVTITDNKLMMPAENVTVRAIFEEDIVRGGACGDKLAWTLTGSGVLTISGTGAMTDYEYQSSSAAPWGTAVTQVILQPGVASIGSYAFYDCKDLTSVTIPGSVARIGDGAFWNCTSLTGASIPEGVVSMGKYTFYACTSLTGATIPSSVASIDSWVFGNCSSLKNVTIPNSVTDIGKGAFNGCHSLTSVTIPGSVTRIDIGAFGNCSSLTDATIPDTVTVIGENAFMNCSSELTFHCSVGSAAYRYATENSIKVK